MTEEGKKLRRPSQKVLNVIVDGLDEIDSYVPFPRRLATESEEVTANPEGELSAEDEDESGQYCEDNDGDRRTEYFDREEMEVALDAFLSALVNAGVIKKSRQGKLPSFSEVFIKFFGQDHELTKKAQSFEDFVEGYFGWISPEDMQRAHEEFLEIYESVKDAARSASNT
jgi:hypothetical protein